MMENRIWADLEHKYAQAARAEEAGFTVSEGRVISGYTSLFGRMDQGGDVVQQGAYAASLKRLDASGRRIKMLWQHDPAQPIGIWDEVHEDTKGLWVKGRLLPEVEKGREAAALLAAGAIDGLSIGYRTVRAERDGKGQRLLQELELWEVSLVTFPMLPDARVGSKTTSLERSLKDLAHLFNQAREELARR